MSYYALSPYYRAIADLHSGKDCGVYADPHLIFYHDGASVGSTAVVGVNIVIDRYKVAFRTYENTVADGDSASAEEYAALLDEAILSNGDGFAIVDIQRRKEGCAFRHGFAENYLHQLMYTFLIADADGVQFLRSLHAGKNVIYQGIISWLVRRNHLAAEVFGKYVVHVCDGFKFTPQNYNESRATSLLYGSICFVRRFNYENVGAMPYISL